MKKLIFISICIVVFCSCQRVYQPQIISTELVGVVVTEHSQNNEISEWLLPYKTTLDNVMGVKIGISAQKMEVKRPESLLGRFVTDVMNDYAKTHGQKFDFTITNFGGLRGSLPQGEVTVGDVYSMFPFDNELVILTLSGKKVEQLCQEIAKRGGEVTDGIKMWIDDNEAKSVLINNASIDTLKNYQVLTTDYLSFGNDNLFALADYTALFSFKMPLREIIIDYIKNEHKNGRKINAKTKGEIFIGFPVIIVDDDWGEPIK